MIGTFYKAGKNRIDPAFKLIGIVAVLSLVIFAFGLTFSSCVLGKAKPVGYQEIVVKPGDTVWNCVRMVYGPDSDIRTLVAKTLELNEIEDGLIYPGSIINIPLDGSI